MSSDDTQWILSAYKVLSTSNVAMHVNEIEKLVRSSSKVSEGPSMPLEVLLTKEAAMGRRFTKPEGSPAGHFSLLPPQPPPTSERQNSTSPSHSVNQNGSASPTDTAVSSNLKYHQKYNQLKKTCKQIIYLNAALYDEISRLEQKIEKASKERRAILGKVMADQSIVNHKEVKTEPPTSAGKSVSGDGGDNSIASGPARDRVAQTTNTEDKTLKRKKNRSSPSPPLKRTKASANEGSDEEMAKSTSVEAPTGSIPKPVKKPKYDDHRFAYSIKIPPINLDPNGRPVMPIELPAGLTIFSIGEINDRPGYCTSASIYPVGYCCTREYACLNDHSKKCLYTCKVSEGDVGPKFEISPDSDQGTILVDDTPEGCHSQLIQLLRQSIGNHLAISSKSDFFGLKHPVVKNLLQCSQGANNCVEYQWSMFEVVRGQNKLTTVQSEFDAASSYKALIKWLRKAADTQSSATDQHPEME